MRKQLILSAKTLAFVATFFLLSGQALADHERRSNPVIVKTIYKEIYRPVINHRVKHGVWRQDKRDRDNYRQVHQHNRSSSRQAGAFRLEKKRRFPKHFAGKPSYRDCPIPASKPYRSGYRNSGSGIELLVRYSGR